MNEIVSYITIDSVKYVNYKDSNGDIHHVRFGIDDIIDKSNLPPGDIIKKDDILPKFVNGMKVFNPASTTSSLFYIKKLPLYDVGLSKGYKTTFMDEVRTYEKMNCLRIRGVPTYHGCIVEDSYISGIVIDGYSSRLEDIKNIEVVTIEKITRSLRATLAELHSNNIVHGDINPSNIMLNAKMDPFIIDFDSSGPSMLKRGSENWMMDSYSKSCNDDIYSLNLVIEYINSKCVVSSN
ncbi:hypothetical protein DL89DRAFT_271265 [Linderina pennispora]|uniref:Protein kinase domain-containing protein n=1 Tax=Linderina pennispora TaxID=61395 RepID=A0A1Y1VVG4_9FUNG|nr:uncharacterized protein DL89DRAFT_271265 [Linderina pennispora]ORX65183.1 hypothetical protein DL89DRAFT_271265 [Linderina pennispora]